MKLNSVSGIDLIQYVSSWNKEYAWIKTLLKIHRNMYPPVMSTLVDSFVHIVITIGSKFLSVVKVRHDVVCLLKEKKEVKCVNDSATNIVEKIIFFKFCVKLWRKIKFLHLQSPLQHNLHPHLAPPRHSVSSSPLPPLPQNAALVLFSQVSKCYSIKWTLLTCCIHRLQQH